MMSYDSVFHLKLSGCNNVNVHTSIFIYSDKHIAALASQVNTATLGIHLLV